MKKHFLLNLLLAFASFLPAQNNIFLVDPLDPIYPDSNSLADYSNTWSTDVPKGTLAEIHVLLEYIVGTSFQIRATMDDKELPLSCWSQLINVPVEQNTGLDSRTEQFKGDMNPHVIRRAPFRIFEVIQPISKDNSIISTTHFTALRLEVPPSFLKEPGKYKVNIYSSGNFRTLIGTFKIRVHDVSLPSLEKGEFFYTNWFNLNQMEEKHTVERWTEPWYDMLDRYAALMAHGRQNCILIPGELISLKENKIVLDEEKMLRFIEVFRKYGFRYFESPFLAYRGDGDDWGTRELVTRLTKKKYYEEKGGEDVAIIMNLIKDFTQKHDLTDNWLQHISDEPSPNQAKCYRDIAKQIKEIYPEIKIMEATNDRDSIVGAVDIWCPLINDFQENEAFFREREKQGEKILVYTCLIPGGKWLNRTLDMEKIRQVYFGWGAAHYNTFGYLHWGLNQYHGDPFAQSVIHHPSPVASANNFLPAGDTHVIYPGKDGPLSSVRFEAHRIGIEDYELLIRLRKGNPKKADKLIGILFRDYTDYETSLVAYRKVKKKLLRAF